MKVQPRRLVAQTGHSGNGLLWKLQDIEIVFNSERRSLRRASVLEFSADSWRPGSPRLTTRSRCRQPRALASAPRASRSRADD